MASYVVMESPARGAEDAVLVRDGFHVVAFILPVVWLLYHRLWIEALAVLVVGMIVGTLGSSFGYGAVAAAAALVLGILVGLEAATLRLAALRRRGWREWGIVEASNPADAEVRYLSERAGQVDDVPPVRPSTSDAIRLGRRPEGPALGMLGYPAKG